MSEGKKVLVVTDDLDRMILQDQLKALGIEVDVIVDRQAAGAIVGGLLALPSTQDEMQQIIGRAGYAGPYQQAAGHLLDRLKEEVRRFTSIYPTSIGLRDAVMNQLREELKLDTDTASQPEIKRSQGHQHPEDPVSTFAAIKDFTGNMLLQLLTELKGIREAVTPRSSPSIQELLKQADLSEALSQSQLSVTQVVEALREHSAKFEGTVPMESKAPGTVSGFIELLTVALLEENPEVTHPSLSIARLGKEERIRLLKLLNPTFTVAVGDFSDTAPFTPTVVFETLLEGLKEDGPRDVHICGMNLLTIQDRANLRYACERAIGKNRAKVAGATHGSFLKGLLEALECDGKVFDSHVVIEGIGMLSDKDLADLTVLFKLGLEDNAEFIDHAITRDVLDHLIKTVGNGEHTAVIINGLKRLNGRSKRNLVASLKHALTKFDELEAHDKKLLASGIEEVPSGVRRNVPLKVRDVPLTLRRLADQLALTADREGLSVNAMSLLSYLLNEAVSKLPVNKLEDGLAPRIFEGNEATTFHIENGVGVHVEFGNQCFTRNEDGSLKIVSKEVDGKTVNTFVLATDGSIKATYPPYMG